jgi:hypothetical protein
MELPDSKSPSLHLTHPTPAEQTATWNLNGKDWGISLTKPAYLERESYMGTVPTLTKNGGITHWILVDRHATPDSRPILGSAESICKPVLVVHPGGQVEEGITHGIGSVFCNPAYRGKGYAGRMLTELGSILKNWQTDPSIPGRQKCPFTILYSDIGKEYYTRLGWHPFPSSHLLFSPASLEGREEAKRLQLSDLPELCAQDEKAVRAELPNPNDGKIHVVLVPDYKTMEWHYMREDFMTKQLFGRLSTTKGAIAGPVGHRVWAIWALSFYRPVDKVEPANKLNILRLVLENSEDKEGNSERLRAILEMARAEALEWKVSGVAIWNPTKVVHELVNRLGVEFKLVDREEESIASLMWHGEGRGTVDEIDWVANEKYGWC